MPQWEGSRFRELVGEKLSVVKPGVEVVRLEAVSKGRSGPPQEQGREG